MRLLVGLVLASLAATVAHAARPTPCSDGTYPLAFLADALGTSDARLILTPDRAALLDGVCAATRARVRQRRGTIRIAARWRECGALGRVRLKAVVDAGTCGEMRGRLVAGGSRSDFESTRAVHVLVFTHTAGFRHPSIADVQRVLGGLDPATGIVTTLTEDPGAFTDEHLARYDVLLFGNTTGDVLDDAQQGAMERFVRGGGGWVGVHSAADTEYDWRWYGRLLGAYFISHPLLPVTVDVTTEDGTHPATAHLPATFEFTDEIYNFDRNPRIDNAILLTIDEAGFSFPNFPPTESMGADHPVAWYKEFDGGRSFYTNLGHRPETWDDPAFVTHLLEGIRWAAASVTWRRLVVTSEARNPMTMAVTPEGDVYWTERTGEVQRWSRETGRATEAARLPVDTVAENGLLGIAVDPGFTTNRWLYLYHSEPIVMAPPSGPPGENVVSRFTVREDGTIDLGTRVDVLRVPSERECCHEGGSLAFAPDGTLFLSVGDNTNPFGDSFGFAPLDDRPGQEHHDARRTAQNPFDLRGKILRINSDGTIPAGNLFPPDGSAGRPEIFTMGNRNPFRTAVDPLTGRLYWGEVGPDAPADRTRGPRGYDEINVADDPGNYGWPFCIADNRAYAEWDYETSTVTGAFTCDGMRPATLAYDYLTFDPAVLGTATYNDEGVFSGRTAIAGAVYRRPSPTSAFAMPADVEGTLLMTEWTRDMLLTVDVDESGTLRGIRRLLAWESIKRPIDVDVAPDGAVYVLEYGTEYGGDNPDARLTRIEYVPDGGLAPVAVIEADRVAGATPLTVAFSGAASRPGGNGDRLKRWLWDFDGDGRTDSRKIAPRRRFTRPGVYPVTLTVVSQAGVRSIPVVQEIVVGNTAPTVVIDAPPDGTVAAPLATVQFRGHADDAEDGVAPCEDLVWDFRRGHNAHAHPWLRRTGCQVSVQVSGIPGHGDGEGFFVAVELSYTDRGGSAGEPALTGRASIRVEIE